MKMIATIRTAMTINTNNQCVGITKLYRFYYQYALAAYETFIKYQSAFL